MVHFNKIIQQAEQLFLTLTINEFFPLSLMEGAREYVYEHKCHCVVQIKSNIDFEFIYPPIRSNNIVDDGKDVWK